MPKTVLKILCGSALLIILQACNFPSASNRTHKSQAGVPITGGGSTSTATLSPTQASPSKPSAVRVRVSVDTNCRTGPGTAYAETSGFRVGQVARVVGRSKDNLYWIIQDPKQPGQLCWLWGHFATVKGNISTLPVFPTPPLPPPTVFPPMPAAPSTAIPTP